MTDYFERMFRFTAWADRRTLASLLDVSGAQAEALPLLAHVLAAEHVWLSRLEGREPRMAVWPTLSLEECAGLAAENEAEYRAYLRRADEAEMGRMVQYRTSQGKACETSVIDILTQVMTHGPYHRGQIAKIIGRCGGKSAGTDYILFVREEDDIAKMVIRDETAADVAAIGAVTVAAFETLAISSHTEQFIVEALRSAGAMTVSLVAEVEGRVVGHIAFSPVTISDGSAGWYGLGPVSVSPALQRRGIGKALIREGLSRIKALGARGCCLVGHPEYYGKLGFTNVTGLGVDGVPPEAFFAMSFEGRFPEGKILFHEGFGAGH